MQARCTAKSKQSGGQCKNRPVTARRVCRMHGGKSLSGFASPSYRTGKWSADLPSRLAGRYQDAASDPELLSLRNSIALIESFIGDELKRLDTGESGRLWGELGKAKTEFNKLHRNRPAPAQSTCPGRRCPGRLYLAYCRVLKKRNLPENFATLDCRFSDLGA